MRVFEKSGHGLGKDIRTWLVLQGEAREFTATHVGVDVPAQAAQHPQP